MAVLAAALAADEQSDSFRVVSPGDVFVELSGTFDASPPDVNLQKSDSLNGTYADAYFDGAEIVYTGADTRRYTLGSGYYRFSVENTGTNAIKISVTGHTVEVPALR